MPERGDYRKVVMTLKERLGKRQFTTFARQDITSILREVSGEPKTRIRALMAQQIELELYKQGLAVYPHLDDTSGKDLVRLYRTKSNLMELIEAVSTPSEEHDDLLRKILRESKATKTSEDQPDQEPVLV